MNDQLPLGIVKLNAYIAGEIDLPTLNRWATAWCADVIRNPVTDAIAQLVLYLAQDYMQHVIVPLEVALLAAQRSHPVGPCFTDVIVPLAQAVFTATGFVGAGFEGASELKLDA